MTRCKYFFLLLVFGFPFATSADAGDEGVQISGTNDKCAEFCSTTFRAQDAAKVSCEQGCRLYSVLQFADKNNGLDALESEPNSTAISETCQHECNNAYKDNGLKAACVSGCQHQSPFTTGHLKIVMDDNSPVFPFAKKLMDKAFGKFGDFNSYMAERFQKLKNWAIASPFMSSPILKIDSGEGDDTSAGILDRIDSKLRQMLKGNSNSDMKDDSLLTTSKERQLIGGAEDVGTKAPDSTVNPLYAYAKSLSRNDGKDSTSSSQIDDSGFVLLDPLNSPMFNSDENGDPIIIVKMIDDDDLQSDYDDHGDVRPFGSSESEDGNKGWFSFTQESLSSKPHEPSPPLSGSDDAFSDTDDTWIACLAGRTKKLTILTRWLLCVALMLSLFCMLYLGLSLVRAGQQRRNDRILQYKIAKGDAVYLMAPPAYGNFDALDGYPVKRAEKESESPPPAYESAVGPTLPQSPDASPLKGM